TQQTGQSRELKINYGSCSVPYTADDGTRAVPKRTPFKSGVKSSRLAEKLQWLRQQTSQLLALTLSPVPSSYPAIKTI
ncbi:hypothetical protein M513_06234, partial [Trichuris suis]